MSENLKSIGENLKAELKVYQLALQDERISKLPKWLLGLAVAYALSPIDLIPDFIPIIGHLDDLIIIPLILLMALKMIPNEVIVDIRQRAKKTSSSSLLPHSPRE